MRTGRLRAATLVSAVLAGAGAAVVEHACASQPGRHAPTAPAAVTAARARATPAPDASAGAPAATAPGDTTRVDAADVSDVSSALATSTRCPQDMVPVHGDYCPVVAQNCLEWDSSRWRCMRYEEPTRCVAARRPMDFCIDRYEWPNRRGARPAVMVSWLEAQALCGRAGKRLCTQDEWTFACEGEAMLPYAYGYARYPNPCNMDHPRVPPDEALLARWPAPDARAYIDSLYEASPSGSHPRCASPFGAVDMIGNVDEWTVNERGVPFVSALKGGWWTTTRARCRAVTLEHYQYFRYYQIGFRCCSAGGS